MPSTTLLTSRAHARAAAAPGPVLESREGHSTQALSAMDMLVTSSSRLNLRKTANSQLDSSADENLEWNSRIIMIIPPILVSLNYRDSASSPGARGGPRARGSAQILRTAKRPPIGRLR